MSPFSLSKALDLPVSSSLDLSCVSLPRLSLPLIEQRGGNQPQGFRQRQHLSQLVLAPPLPPI